MRWETGTGTLSPKAVGVGRTQRMSRHLEKLANGEFEETIVNYEECKWLYDDVCCNDSSEWLADFPLDFCKTCRYFKKERR